MSTIGKVFVVLNLILSALFLGWAINALNYSQEWKTKHDDVVKLNTDFVAQKDKQISELTVSSANATKANVITTQQRDQLDGTVKSLQNQISNLNGEKAKMQADLGNLGDKLSTYNDRLSSLEKTKDQALERAKTAEDALDQTKEMASKAEMELKDSQDALRTTQQLASELKDKLGASTTLAEKTQRTLDTVVAQTGVKLSDINSQKYIEGAVLDVRLDVKPGLVMLNVGSSKSVTPGMTFEIYQGATYKGQVRVQNVQGNMCSALVTHAVSGTSMAQGDLAATRIL